ncbi:hypothetical protein CIB84_003553, partial [Bambusicola thoracicus]
VPLTLMGYFLAFFWQWCRRGQCVKYGDHGPKPVNGHWSAWSEWSQCTRTCGGGVTYQERHCNNPKPQYGGKFCQGSSRIYELCNNQPCPASSLDFRAQQCAEYNSKPFRGWYYKWKPYTKVEEEDRCKLYCTAEDFDFFFAMSSKVKDGTLCSPNKYDVCIDGICEQVGCDHGLGSKAVLDACGVCKGDNSTCKFFKGQYLIQHKANDYYAVVTIPAGARSIHLQEMQISTSYLAVRNLSKKYYLTGDWTIDWPGKFPFAGTVFDYQRSFNHPESLYAAGPTNETLVFEVSFLLFILPLMSITELILLQGRNPGIAWEYTFSKMNENKTSVKKHSHSWVTVQSECSATCGGGSSNEYFFPSQCSKTCGRGVKKRDVYCTSTSSPKLKILPESMCSQDHKPESQQTCVLGRCPKNDRLQWVIASWSECSASCGPAVRKRELKCGEKSIHGKLITFPQRRCRNIKKPNIDLEEACNNGPCPSQTLYNMVSGWYSSPWQQ